MAKVEQWQLTGNAAELYEKALVPHLFAHWAADLIGVAALQDGHRVLDVACGTGVVARIAARRVGSKGQVTGLDLNPGMISVARSLPPPAGATITWVEGSALAMSFADESFDVVLCQQGFQFFPDRRAALDETYRVLVRGGRLLLSIWEGANPYSLAMYAAVEQYVGPEPAATLREGRATPEPETIRCAMSEAGFRDVQIHRRTLTTRLPAVGDFVLRHLSASPVSGAVAAIGSDARAALSADVDVALRDYIDGDGVAFSEACHVLTGVR